MTGGGAGESDRPGAGNIDDAARTNARGDRAVIAGGEDVAEERQVLDLRHRLVFVGKLEEIEIGVGDEDVFRLPAAPTAHVNVTVRRAGA